MRNSVEIKNTFASLAGIKVTDDDVINLEDFLYDTSLPAFLFHDHGFTLGVVFAEHLQEGIDVAADNGALDCYLIDESEYGEYGMDTDNPTCEFIGNSCKPADLETLGVIEIGVIPVSFVALITAPQVG